MKKMYMEIMTFVYIFFCSNALFMYFLDYQKSEYSTIRGGYLKSESGTIVSYTIGCLLMEGEMKI